MHDVPLRLTRVYKDGISACLYVLGCDKGVGETREVGGPGRLLALGKNTNKNITTPVIV